MISDAVFRRELGSNNWGSPIANLAADDSSFKDNNIDKHTIYEYSVVRTCTDIEPFSITGAQMEAYGFVTSGIELNVIHFRGELLLLVNRLIYDSLSAELDILSYDLIGDGWNVSMAVVEDSDSVPSVKQMILNKYESDEGLDAIYLLGHIPVPYSGAYCDNLDWNSPPDGHGSTDPNSHCGAWTADEILLVKLD
jgi:hypothetical protein